MASQKPFVKSTDDVDYYVISSRMIGTLLFF